MVKFALLQAAVKYPKELPEYHVRIDQAFFDELLDVVAGSTVKNLPTSLKRTLSKINVSDVGPRFLDGIASYQPKRKATKTPKVLGNAPENDTRSSSSRAPSNSASTRGRPILVIYTLHATKSAEGGLKGNEAARQYQMHNGTTRRRIHTRVEGQTSPDLDWN